MKIVYEEGDEVKLRRVEEYSDPDDWGLTQEEYDALVQAQEDEVRFEITCEAADDYYDIIGEDGTKVNAVSAYNLMPDHEYGEALALMDL